MLQLLVVTLLVIWCTGYALWTLLPAAGKRRIALALLQRQLPAFIAGRLRPHASAESGCGCDGCDRAPKATKPTAGVTPIVFHPRRPR